MTTTLPILDADEIHDFFMDLENQLKQPSFPLASTNTPKTEAPPLKCPARPVKPLNGKQMINKDVPPPFWALSPVARPDRRKGIPRKAINRNKGLRITGIRLCLHCTQKNTAKEWVIEICDKCVEICDKCVLQ